MRPEGVRAEIETEWSWRSDELRLLRNQLSLVNDEQDRERLRRPMVVMLYAHLEGFCRNAVSIYLEAVNAESLETRAACFELAAASLANVFEALISGDKKNRVFRRTLPSDEKLHRLTRQRDFLEQASAFDERPLILDPATVVDTESNLKPSVLKKMLYQVGLDPDLCDKWADKLSMLLNRRNNIAHGAERAGIAERTYAEMETAVEHVVQELSAALFAACVDGRYLRKTA